MWVWDEVDRRFFASRGIPFTQEYGEIIAMLGFEGGAAYTIEHFRLQESAEDIIEEWKQTAAESYATQVMLKPGAKEYLRCCKEAGLPISIATSLQRNLLEPALKNNGIYGMFDAICVCDELGEGGKSRPFVYEEAARLMGVGLEQCAVFEDVVTPAKTAKDAGAYVVGVYDEHKQQSSSDLRRVADFFIESWHELL